MLRILMVGCFLAGCSVVPAWGGPGGCVPATAVDDVKEMPAWQKEKVTKNPAAAVDDVKEMPADTMAREDSVANARMNIGQKIRHTGNIFVRFVKSFDDIDTTYIVPNYYNYAAMLQNTNFFQSYRLKGEDGEGNEQTLLMAPKPSFRVGPYFGWRWIFLGYTFDVSHPNSAGKTTEFSLSLYSSMLGLDLVYIKNKGDFNIRKVSGFGEANDRQVRNVTFGGADSYTSGINAYYVFNHKRFSYPAAFAQSTVQRKSCGSWMLGLRYDSQKFDFDHTQLPSSLLTPAADNPGLFESMKIASICYRNYSVSCGYAYNWVFAPRFLFSISIAPSIGIKQIKGERLTGESLWTNVKNLNFDCISRVALVWNNNRWFAGVSVIDHIYDYRRDRFTMTNMVNYVNVYFGLNFNKRRAYRSPHE